MKIHILQHVPFEGPGYIRQWCENNGHEISITRFFQNNHCLPEISSIDALVIMGGPMSVYDDSLYSWLQNEKSYIRRASNAERKS